MIAEYERAKIMERCRRGKLHKARTGIVNPLSGAPYGYLYVRKTEQEPARYQVLLHEAKVVRSVFQWLVEEQVSIGEITRRLRAQGAPTRTGKGHWDRSVVWAILRNPAYAGHAAFGKTEAIPRGKLLRPIRSKNPTPRRAKSTYRDKPANEWISIPVPAIVSPEIFATASEQLERNRQLSARNLRGQRYLLQGLVVCARCRYAFYGKQVSLAAAKRKVTRYAYYRCVGSDGYRFAGGRVCHNPQVRVDQLDGYVWESVLRVMKDPAQVLEEWSQRGATDGTVAELRTQRDEAKKLLVAQEHTLRRLRDAYEAGAVDLEDLVARSDRVRARIKRARQELDDAEAQLKQTIELTAMVGRLSEFANQVRDGLDKLDWQQRRQLIRTLVARVELDEDGATVIYRVPAPAAPPPDNESPSGGGEVCHLRWGRERTTLWHPFVPLHHYPVGHDAGFEVATNEPQYPLVRDALLQPPEQNIEVDPVKESLEINICHYPFSPLDVLLRLAHRIVCAPPRSEAVAMLREGGVEHRLQDLQDALLDKPVERGRNAELAHTSPTLGYLHFPHRHRLVGPREQLRPDDLPVLHQVLRQLVDGHPVHAGTALVLPHSLQRCLDILPLNHPLHQVVAS